MVIRHSSPTLRFGSGMTAMAIMTMTIAMMGTTMIMIARRFGPPCVGGSGRLARMGSRG